MFLLAPERHRLPNYETVGRLLGRAHQLRQILLVPAPAGTAHALIVNAGFEMIAVCRAVLRLPNIVFRIRLDWLFRFSGACAQKKNAEEYQGGGCERFR
jgi:hypothetical protein